MPKASGRARTAPTGRAHIYVHPPRGACAPLWLTGVPFISFWRSPFPLPPSHVRLRAIDHRCAMIPVFDGHNDILLRLFLAPERREAIWKGCDRTGHLDLPRMRQGGFAGGMFAIYIPSPMEGDPAEVERRMASSSSAVPGRT